MLPSKQTHRPAAHSWWWRLAAGVPLLLGLGGCGSSTGPGGAGESDMTARIDGTDWASDLATVAVVPNTPGWYVITGSRTMGNPAIAISISVFNVDGPGTYPLGVGGTSFGGIATVAEGGGGWNTPLSGASGSITITALTATRMAGTFAFGAEAVTGGASGTRTVTNGDFDLEFATANPLTPVPDEAGSRVTATIGGAAWNAATIAGGPVSNDFVLSSSNDLRTMSLILNNITGPGTYQIGAGQSHAVLVLGPALDPQGDPCCWNEATGNTGSVTIATMTGTRVTGTFSATLAPTAGTGATTPLVITGGVFDVGIPQF